MEIHRSRFVPYPSSAINALAFSHTTSEKNSSEDPSSLRLAIGRVNGNIEIWNPGKGIWVQEKTFSGGRERSVEGLAWIQEPGEAGKDGESLPGKLRLFSIGYSSSVTEWNLVTGLPARNSGGNHSEVWCFAAQPQWVEPKKRNKESRAEREGEFKGQNLVAGCADGTLAIISTAEDDLRFQKFLARPTKKKARVLSVAYQDRDRVVAGYADSTIRVFDSRTGQAIRSISLGSGPRGGPREILVWRVRCLPNGDIVSGDSSGQLRFFSGDNYSQTQRLDGHETDIFDLAVSKDGQYIFTGGSDRRTALFKYTKSSARKGAGSWAKVTHSKLHSHDIKALAIYDGKDLSVAISGGIDTQPIVVPLREFGKEYSRALPFLPQIPPLASAPSVRLLVSWWNCEIRIWRVPKNTINEQRPKLVAKMALLGDENITSAAVSTDGRILAVATVAEVKLFQLESQDSQTGDKFSISKVHCSSLPGARLVQFSGDGKWLVIITHTEKVQLARLVSPDDSAQDWKILPRLVTLTRFSRIADPDSLNRTWGNYYRTITHAEFSNDSTVLAVGELGGHIDVWAVEGNEDPTAAPVDVAPASSSSSSADNEDSESEEDEAKQSITIMGQHWRKHPNAAFIPKLDSAPLVLSFRPASPSSRPLPNGNPAVHATRHNPHPHSHELPGGEQRLVVVSAKHSVYEFDLLNGGLGGFSDWSRRNPTSNFPTAFTGNKDRTKGCLWDIHEGRERLWLYGVNWLFMLDLSKDLPELKATISGNGTGQVRGDAPNKRKRKSGADGPRKKSSGAGDAIASSDVLSYVRKFVGGASHQSKWISLDASSSPDADEDVEDKGLALSLERRAVVADSDRGNEDVVMQDDQEDSASGDGAEEGKALSRQKSRKREAVKERGVRESWWHTFKYRPILGIVPIGERSGPLEAVLVERPTWDLDLPARFVGNHERSV